MEGYFDRLVARACTEFQGWSPEPVIEAAPYDIENGNEDPFEAADSAESQETHQTVSSQELEEKSEMTDPTNTTLGSSPRIPATSPALEELTPGKEIPRVVRQAQREREREGLLHKADHFMQEITGKPTDGLRDVEHGEEDGLAGTEEAAFRTAASSGKPGTAVKRPAHSLSRTRREQQTRKQSLERIEFNPQQISSGRSLRREFENAEHTGLVPEGDLFEKQVMLRPRSFDGSEEQESVGDRVTQLRPRIAAAGKRRLSQPSRRASEKPSLVIGEISVEVVPEPVLTQVERKDPAQNVRREAGRESAKPPRSRRFGLGQV